MEYLKKIPSTPAQVTAAIDEVLRLYKGSVESTKASISRREESYREAGIEADVKVKALAGTTLKGHILDVIKIAKNGVIWVTDTKDGSKWRLKKWDASSLEVVK